MLVGCGKTAAVQPDTSADVEARPPPVTTSLEAWAVSDGDIAQEVPLVDRVIAHHLAWFGSPGHIDVGYLSGDPGVVAAQIQAARGRGIRGFAVDWYADQVPSIDAAAAALQTEAALYDDFEVGLVYDYGALLPDPDQATERMIADLTLAHERFIGADAQAPPQAYLHLDDKPVLMWFTKDGVAPDLAQVRAAMETLDPAPLLIDLHPDDQAAAHVDGFQSWVSLEGEWGEPYLGWFYDTMAQVWPGHLLVGAAWPGFDDRLASWGSGRTIDGRCGATLYDTLALSHERLSAHGLTAPLLQLVTWNDYEEGTELEPGVDACLEITLEGTTDGATDTLSWTIADPSGLSVETAILRGEDDAALVEIARTTDDSARFDHEGDTARYRAVLIARPLLQNAISEPITLP